MQNHQVPCSIKSAWYYSFYHEIFTFEIILFNWFDQLFIHMLNLFTKVISQWIEKKNWRHIRTTQATKLPNAFFRSFLLSCLYYDQNRDAAFKFLSYFKFGNILCAEVYLNNRTNKTSLN